MLFTSEMHTISKILIIAYILRSVASSVLSSALVPTLPAWNLDSAGIKKGTLPNRNGKKSKSSRVVLELYSVKAH